MTDPTDLTAAIEAVAAGPRSAEADGLKAEAQPLPDLIAADQYLAAKAASLKKSRGMRITQLLPPGAT